MTSETILIIIILGLGFLIEICFLSKDWIKKNRGKFGYSAGLWLLIAEMFGTHGYWERWFGIYHLWSYLFVLIFLLSIIELAIYE